MFAKTVGELIFFLQDMPRDSVVIGAEPPFDGIKIVPQGNGKVLLAADYLRAGTKLQAQITPPADRLRGAESV